MFVMLGKVVGPLLSPLGLVLGLWAGAGLLHWRGRPRLARWTAVTGGMALLAFGSPLVGEVLLGSLEDDYPVLPVTQYPPAGAIVVLGGMTDPPLPPRREVEAGSAIDRLLQGLRLLRAGKAPILVFSGGNIPELSGTRTTEAGQMRELAILCGVPPEALVLEDSSRTTRENAVFTARLLRRRGIDRVLLVTSASHLRRAMGVFTTEGVRATPVPADVRVVERPYRYLQVVPTLWGLECSTWAAKEYCGYWVYWLRGWIR